jgi:hypothetical protein
MPGCTVPLSVVLPYWQHGHRSALDDFFNLVDLVVFLTQGLQSTHSVSKKLDDAIGLELAFTDDFGGKKKDEESDGLNGDLEAKNGKHWIT